MSEYQDFLRAKNAGRAKTPAQPGSQDGRGIGYAPPGTRYSSITPSPGLGAGGVPVAPMQRPGHVMSPELMRALAVPGTNPGPAFTVNPSYYEGAAPSPGLGFGMPMPGMYEDFTPGYGQQVTDPLVQLFLDLLSRRHPNGM